MRTGAIVITGVTGWVGRTMIEYLLQALPPLEFEQRVRAFGSRSCSLLLSNQRKIDIQPLTLLPELAKQEPIDSLFHAAFLTPDRASEIGLHQYCEINTGITSIVCEALRSRPSARSVLFSSGAAELASAAHAQLDQGSALHSYGQLKLDEEKALGSLSSTLVLRIYGLTGRFIREPSRYALGDFLCCAYRNEPIVIQSIRRVVRGYVAACDLSALAWEWARSSDEAPRSPLDAVAETIDLLALAEMIASMYCLPPVRSSIDEALPANVYSASSRKFLTFLERYDHKPMPTEQQIRDTFDGISAYLAY